MWDPDDQEHRSAALATPFFVGGSCATSGASRHWDRMHPTAVLQEPHFFSLPRIALKDRPKGPSTANR